ncbi:hypothetical protein K2173_014152 [Erythroxylum novogranatense]|uniref:RING-type domain-containing protein n=1 Tax=Erythroxylum novogranatense TaxID=1862640 RepID=A0AAV8SDG3_9ROSI|nr:hypothetical protein K2173_014152 [Erythroxylum novogranatense]
MMREFDDNIPARAFDNFQFVNFIDIMRKNYKATIDLGILGNNRRRGSSPERVPLPPPLYGASFSNISKPSNTNNFQPHKPSYSGYDTQFGGYETPVVGYDTSVNSAPPSSSYDNQVCPICLTNPKDMAFGCGHQTCCDCGEDLQSYPICRSPVNTRIRLY